MVKNVFIKHIALIVLMLIAGATTSVASAQKDVELVVASDGNSKQDATISALRSALEQVYGAFVSSNTKIMNDRLVSDEMVSITNGVVKKYTYLTEKEIAGKYYVVLKAIISPQKLLSYAQPNGTSSIKIDGAQMATDMRLKKINEKNRLSALNNIREMQAKLQ